VRLLEQPTDQGHGLDLADVGDLGQGDHEPVGERGPGQQAAEEQVQGAEPAAAGGGLQGPDAQAGVRRGGRRGQGPGRGQGIGVLPLGRPRPVAVLEVHLEILDRLALQLGQHVREDPGDQVRVEGGGRGQGGRGGGVLPEGGQGPGAPVGGDVGASRSAGT
jgi:hypothetical protein